MTVLASACLVLGRRLPSSWPLPSNFEREDLFMFLPGSDSDYIMINNIHHVGYFK